MFEPGKNGLLRFKGDGQAFAELVDRLIRAEAMLAGIGQDQIRDQLRAHVKHGGVDTEVR